MYSKKINQLATNLNPQSSDLIPIGDANTGQLKTTTFGNIFGTSANGIISGGVVTWSGTGLLFNVSACQYSLYGIRYTTAATTITLTASDPTNARIDVIAVNTSSQVVLITGTPSTNPIEPQVDPFTQIQLTNITVNAGSTTPNISNVLIYDENVETWTKTDSGLTSINYASTVNPYTGSKCILATFTGYTTDKHITFTSPTTLNSENYSVIKFAIKLSRPLVYVFDSIYVNLRISGNTYGLVPWIAMAGPNATNVAGFDYTSTSWQLISVPIVENFSFTDLVFFVNSYNSPLTINIDRIELQNINNSLPVTQSKSFGIVQTSSGAATAQVPTDTLTLSSSGLTTLSATGKTLTIATPTPIPSQTGNTGKFLTTNGSIVSWAFPTDTGITSLNGLTTTTQTFATGTSGTDFGISSATSTHTFNLPTASATNRGALSSSDWSTFNGKENVLTFSSPLSRSVNTISIPAATNSVNGYLTSTDWTTFNGKQNAITLTTTGTSGAATLIGATLNIPNYTVNPVARVENTFTATAGQTTFSVTYTVGQIDVYYNGSKLAPAEFTANNGTSVVLAIACLVNDIVNIITYVTSSVAGISGTTNYIAKFTGTTTVGNSLIYDNGTNVGIGTNNPVVKLQVKAATNINLGIQTGTTDTLGIKLNAFNDAGNANVPIEINGSILILKTNEIERARITSGGNLLLGTTTDAGELLQVNGTCRFSGAVGIGGTAGTAGTKLFIQGSVSSIFDAAGTRGISFYPSQSSIHFITSDYIGTSYYPLALSARMVNSDLYLSTAGNVGIGTTSPAYKLQLSTDSAAKPSTNTWTIASDERVKENIIPYTKGLDVVMQINPITYDYNGKAGFDKIKDNIGVIAQDIKDILPESISTYFAKLNEDDVEDTELFNFNSHALTYVLINAIKEQQESIQQLSAKVESQEQTIKTLLNGIN